MSNTDFSKYLSPEFPKFTESETQLGNEYRYVCPDKVAKDSLPVSGEIWEDGRPLTDVKVTPSLGNSGWSEVNVTTVYNSTQTVLTIGKPDEIRYALRASVSQVELCQHPDFLPGGPSDLYTTPVTSGSLTELPIIFAFAWENEPDPITKAQRKFYRRDGNGNLLSTTQISVPAGAALAYVKLRMLGYTTVDVYNPVFQKISTYRGDQPPVTEGWGQYLAASDGFLAKVPSEVKAKYPQWIRSGDDIERVGNKARWQRTEQATGYTKVYFDVDTLNPASNTIP